MDREGPGEETGLPRRRLSPLIALLFLASAFIVLGGLVTSYVRVSGSPGQDTPDLQPRIDQASTEQARFVTESANINITETVAAAIATARPFTETAYAPTGEALQTAYAATVTAYAPTNAAYQTAYAPTLDAYQTASIATQTAYAPTAEAYQTIYPPTYEALLTAYSLTDTAYAPTREAFLTAYPITETAYAATSAAFQTAYASTARAKGTTTVQPPTMSVAMVPVSAYYPPPSGSFDAAELAESEAENLDKGRYLFNAPSEMTAGNKYRVELRIVRDTLSVTVVKVFKNAT